MRTFDERLEQVLGLASKYGVAANETLTFWHDVKDVTCPPGTECSLDPDSAKAALAQIRDIVAAVPDGGNTTMAAIAAEIGMDVKNPSDRGKMIQTMLKIPELECSHGGIWTKRIGGPSDKNYN